LVLGVSSMLPPAMSVAMKSLCPRPSSRVHFRTNVQPLSPLPDLCR
jgi:hypothetical protein